MSRQYVPDNILCIFNINLKLIIAYTQLLFVYLTQTYDAGIPVKSKR